MFLIKKFIAVILVVLLGVPAYAQDIGMRFDQMPKGTRMYFEASNGKKWNEHFIGKRGKRYVVHVIDGHTANGRRTRIDSYDLKGRLVQYSVGNAGLRFRFRPYDCSYQLGSCKHTRKQLGDQYVHSGQTRTWNVQTEKAKNGRYASAYTQAKSDLKGALVFKLGKYNIRDRVEWFEGGKLQWVRLVRIAR